MKKARGGDGGISFVLFALKEIFTSCSWLISLVRMKKEDTIYEYQTS